MATPLRLRRTTSAWSFFISRTSMLSLVSFLLVSIPCTGYSFSPGDLYRQAKASTVLIVGINEESHALSFGSGVFISAQGVILTNAHVVEDSTRFFVYIQNQTIESAVELLAIDSDLDVAALRIPTKLPVPFLRLAAGTPDDGTPTIAVGYPRLPDVLHMGLTLHPTVMPMTITGQAIGRSRTAGLPVPFLQTVGMLNAGSSGGPLVDSETGEVAGLVVHTVPYLEPVKNDRGQRVGTAMMRAGLSYSIPVSRLRDWLENNHISFMTKQTHEDVLTPLEKERPIRAFLTTAHLLHLMATVLHQESDHLQLAVQHYESALQLEPERPDVLRNLGLALAALGETDRARATYERAYAHTPSDPILLRNMGEMKYRMHDNQGAAELYWAAIRQDPCLVSAFFALGTVLQAQGQAEEAQQIFTRAAACPASSSDVYHQGRVLEQQGLRREALQVWEDFLERAHSASLDERPLFKKIRQRVTQLRAQLTPPDREVNLAPISSSAQSAVPNNVN
jgi:Tfp pilus assembly protein PilF